MNRWQKKIYFPNGWGISILAGNSAMADSNGRFEIGLILGTQSKHCLHYGGEFPKAVKGYQNANDVRKWIDKISAYGSLEK
jgi:hypothetical protein